MTSALVLALFVSLAVAAPSPAAEIVSIESAELEEAGEEVRLHLQASGSLKWTVRSDREGNVVVRLPDSTLGPRLADLALPSGLVSAVEFRSTPTSGSQESIVTVHTRLRPAYSVTTQGNRLTLALRPAPTSEGSAAGGDLIVGPGDLLSIEVFGFQELSRKVRVMRDGTVTLPLLGNVPLTGLNLQAVEQRIGDLLTERQFVKDPQVAVYLEEVVSRAVTVQGGVGRPGIYPLRGRRTLLEILGEAGGLAAGERSPGTIVILRDNGRGVRDRIDIDAERLVSLEDFTLNLELEPGDIVMVPSPRRARIYVSGAVGSPGPVEFLTSEGLTIFQAILSAGGPTDRASLGKVFVNRQLDDGTIQRFKINVKKIQKGKAEDFALEPDDIVIVKESKF